MSVITTLYNATATIKRKTIGTYSNVDSTIASSIPCVLRPVTDKAQLFNETNFGIEYNIFLDDGTDVKVGDTIAIANINYGVQTVLEYEDLEDDADSHLKLVVNKLTR